MESNDFLKSVFFKNIKMDLKHCWAPGSVCKSVAIKAHSVQNKKVLEILSSDGFVIMPQEKIIGNGDIPIVGFTEIGRNRATTFTGLCKLHDTKIFSPIDNFELDLSNNQQLFLIAYRAVLKKFYSLTLDAIRTRKMYEDAIQVSVAWQPSERFVDLLRKQQIRAFGAYFYKEKFDKAYLSDQYDIVRHEMFSFQHQRPTIAASTLYWLEILKPNNVEVPWIVLNVFPTAVETHVIISYLVEDAEHVASEIKQIFNSSLKRRLCLLSEKIVGLSENFVISPTYWNNLSIHKRDSIVTYYRDTLFARKTFDGNLRNLCLFELSNKRS